MLEKNRKWELFFFVSKNMTAAMQRNDIMALLIHAARIRDVFQ